MTATFTVARVVPHDVAEPSCYGCSRGRPCSDACSACACRWSGEPRREPEECPEAGCICHEDEAVECGSCAAIGTDVVVLDMGRGLHWTICTTCREKWRSDS